MSSLKCVRFQYLHASIFHYFTNGKSSLGSRVNANLNYFLSLSCTQFHSAYVKARLPWLTEPAGRAHIFSIYHLRRISLLRYDSRNAADTVGVNGVYVPVECILIIRGGIFEATIPSPPLLTHRVRAHVKFSHCSSCLCADSLLMTELPPLYTYFRLFNLRLVFSSR